jgi:hypothetical protein
MNQFYSLDGNLYSFVNSRLQLLELLDKMNQYKKGGNYKIFSSQFDLQADLEETLLKYPRLRKLDYNTNFFELNKDQIPNVLDKLEHFYQPNIQSIAIPVSPKSNPQEIEILLDFSLHVSAYKWIDNSWVGDDQRIKRCHSFFHTALEQEDLKAYLVTNMENQLAGSFCLVETDFDVQLESVSGKCQKNTTLTGYKFPYIIDSILTVYSSQFSHKPLRFSSSKTKVIGLYDQVGFGRNDQVHAIKIEVI